jgi:hypothetical protein
LSGLQPLESSSKTMSIIPGLQPMKLSRSVSCNSKEVKRSRAENGTAFILSSYGHLAPLHPPQQHTFNSYPSHLCDLLCWRKRAKCLHVQTVFDFFYNTQLRTSYILIPKPNFVRKIRTLEHQVTNKLFVLSHSLSAKPSLFVKFIYFISTDNFISGDRRVLTFVDGHAA